MTEKKCSKIPHIEDKNNTNSFMDKQADYCSPLGTPMQCNLETDAVRVLQVLTHCLRDSFPTTHYLTLVCVFAVWVSGQRHMLEDSPQGLEGPGRQPDTYVQHSRRPEESCDCELHDDDDAVVWFVHVVGLSLRVRAVLQAGDNLQRAASGLHTSAVSGGRNGHKTRQMHFSTKHSPTCTTDHSATCIRDR